ncbi:hypothetical protein [Candidatus Magnetobacterium casense]|uniref:Uncharacterized protein n=1 Tax=Candidatus Magnetobacterium casense TaxID=1455061 RepID=A0ABS6RV38_9BACT|nr:hypothetical protein [Candidatus Magnetobacterium casensis]MBV6340451.1 hypothetical protein [Candidatus Magnetobacterium casensis]
MPECVESLLTNTHALRDNGHNVMPYIHSGDCYIARARNMCVELFLNTTCTDLIFVDSDVAFDKDAMLKLLKHDKGIVAGAYPYRKTGLEFPVVLKFDEATNNCLDEKTGLVSATGVPAGFMRINRRVFEQMASHYKMERDSRGLCTFFDTGKLFGDNVWYGEDATFCKRWVEMGGEIWVEPNINFKHIGTQKFEGNYFNFLSGGNDSRV